MLLFLQIQYWHYLANNYLVHRILLFVLHATKYQPKFPHQESVDLYMFCRAETAQNRVLKVMNWKLLQQKKIRYQTCQKWKKDIFAYLNIMHDINWFIYCSFKVDLDSGRKFTPSSSYQMIRWMGNIYHIIWGIRLMNKKPNFGNNIWYVRKRFAS